MSDTIRIELWTWPLDVGEDERARLAAYLSEDERARAERFVFDRDRERCVVARGRMREILARFVAAPPAELRFAYSEHRKPTLAEPRAALHFNLSHSNGLAALGISREAELGLDIEAIEPLKEDVAERYFSRREVAALRALPEDDRLPGFYRCWTRKEAVLKSLGDGLMRALDSFDVTLSADARLERLDGEPDAPQTWQLIHFEPATGFTGAIALRAHGARVVLTRRV